MRSSLLQVGKSQAKSINWRNTGYENTFRVGANTELCWLIGMTDNVFPCLTTSDLLLERCKSSGGIAARLRLVSVSLACIAMARACASAAAQHPFQLRALNVLRDAQLS